MRPRSAMEPSGPCVSDRPGTSSTSSGTAPPVLPCNIEAKVESNSLANWHVACCIGCMRHKQWALCGGGVLGETVPRRHRRGAPRGVGEKQNSENEHNTTRK